MSDSSAAASVPEDPLSYEHVIARYGHVVVSVGYGECDVPGCNCGRSPTPWSYSVGLTDQGFPELVVLGLDTPVTGRLINEVARRWLDGTLDRHAETFTYRGGTFRLVDVPDRWVLDDRSRMAAWFERQRWPWSPTLLPEVRQVVWPDEAGRYPDDDDAPPATRRAQPILRDRPSSYPARGSRAARRAEARARDRRRRRT
jgi:hypothetical protein